MKIMIIPALVAFLLCSCSLEKPTIEKAREVAEKCLKAADQGDVKTIREDCYTSEFVRAETEEQLIDKFKKLKQVTGAIRSFALTESVMETEMGEEACVRLVYSAKHARVTTREEFVVVIEGGKHKIGSHLVTNE